MAANVNNYISAGNAAVRSAVKSRAALARNKPQMSDLGSEKIKQDALEVQTAMASNANVANQGLDAVRAVANQKNWADADKKVTEIKKEVRKAGLLAGGAALLGAGAMYMRKKDEPNEMLGIVQNQAQYWRNKADFYKNKGDSIDSETAPERTKYEPFNYTPKNTGSSDTSTDSDSDSGSGSTVASGNVDASDGWKRLSRVIAFGEGTLGEKGYTTQFTGTQFSDTSRHPRQIRSSNGLSSDAAGKYQFLSTTWDGAKKALGLKDFSPQSQEAAGRYLTKNRGVNPDAVYKTKEEFKTAMTKLSKEWASLPYGPTGTSYYGQGGKTLDQLWEVYNQ